ncbi:MAG: NUDIX hydrolase [Nocardioidaceae bacterium]
MSDDLRPEIDALVDHAGNVVGSAPRPVVRRDNLLHAATAVLVRNAEGQIYLHRRAPTKDWAPGFHDCAPGGVLQAGETPDESARRELAEELGIEGAALRRLGTSLYEDASTRCLEHCYEVTWRGLVHHADEEVVWGAWVTLEELDERLRDPGWPFVPDTRQLLSRLAAAGTGDYSQLASLTPGRP